jgi:hypothetical protein
MTEQQAYPDNAIVTPEQVRVALKLSDRQWARTKHLLPWSCAFGERCPRITWGQVVAVVKGGGLQIVRRRA